MKRWVLTAGRLKLFNSTAVKAFILFGGGNKDSDCRMHGIVIGGVNDNEHLVSLKVTKMKISTFIREIR